MAKVTRMGSKGYGNKKVKRKPLRDGAESEVLRLPTEYEEPAGDLNQHSIMIHGEKKIGKTSLALQGGKVLLVNCDPPQRAYRRLEMHCPTWKKFKAVLKLLQAAAAKGKFPYERVVLDGADLWYTLCLMYVCDKLAIEHPGDEDFGKGWHEVRKEFTAAVDAMLALPCGVWFICHSGWKEHKTRDGRTIDRLLPRLTGQAEEILNGKVDAWFAYDYDEKNRRVLVLQGDESTGAGHRLSSDAGKHFVDSEGKPLKQIRMGRSPVQAYDNFLSAFNNEYTEPAEASGKKKGGIKRKKKVARS